MVNIKGQQIEMKETSKTKMGIRMITVMYMYLLIIAIE